MFFYASKIIGALIWPSSVITLLLLAGVVLMVLGRGLQWAKRLLTAGVVLLIVCGLSPLGNWMLLPLEQRFARGALPGEIAGVILLGGFELPGISRARGQLSLSEGAERLTEGILVALQRPKARVIFVGGDASLIGERRSAGGPIASYMQAVGIAPERIVLEEHSRTTHENSVFLARMLPPKPGDRYVLVTSAFHMPRSVGTFRRIGFDVIPWPVDYRTRGRGDFWEGFGSIPSGLERLDLAFKEWLGLLAYRLSGRTGELWPGPESAGPGPAEAGAVAVPAR